MYRCIVDTTTVLSGKDAHT